MFWKNLKDGVSAITVLKDSELEYSHSRNRDVSDQRFVAARSLLESVDLFDSDFFGIYPKQADVMDPQHRIFLECAWEALESAGYPPDNYPGAVGLYAGSSLNTYLLYNLGSQPGFTVEMAAGYPGSDYDTLFGNDKDFLTTRVAHKLNFRGPCVTVQSACSTSLVAVTQACQSLRARQCDLALAGGVSITFPQRRDYLYQEKGMLSADGTCRSFDAGATGTVFGSGAGIVVLKRLSRALQDRDTIHAVILGYGVNNDGSARVGYAAPGVQGQSEVIRLAHENAGVDADSISYVEAHGTGTPLGDPIEVAALTQAFRKTTQRKGFCALGTAKTHVGHLDIAAGVIGLIKTVLQLKKEHIPALLGFQGPNPKIHFASTPFFPANSSIPWPRGSAPRRAGVSAFGVGGTNAHVVLEEAPHLPEKTSTGMAQLWPLSAKTLTALEATQRELVEHLEVHREISVQDIAFTLQLGRKSFPHRRIVVVGNMDQALEQLKCPTSPEFTGVSHAQTPKALFLFPGQGAQYPQMGRQLYAQQRVFRSSVDLCADLLLPFLGRDIRSVLYPESSDAGSEIHATRLTQPCLFVTEYALAQLWMAWGIRPTAVLGHSVGEYVAAVLAGTFSLQNALRLLAIRAQLMQALPGGSMLAVRAPLEGLLENLPADIALAAANSPNNQVFSGPTSSISRWKQMLDDRGIATRSLQTSHAFHSSMMDPMLESFSRHVRDIPSFPPTLPWVSTLTGKWITDSEAQDPEYWVRQLRNTVRLEEALATATECESWIFIEAGPGRSLTQALLQGRSTKAPVAALSSLGMTSTSDREWEHFLGSLGRCWIHGLQPDWTSLQENTSARRVPLPTYPFERRRHWVDPHTPPFSTAAVSHPKTNTSNTQPLDPLRDGGSTSVSTLSSMVTCTPPNPSTESTTSSRNQQMEQSIQSLFKELSGMEIRDPSVSFLELGFDSLFLTQVSTAIQKRFRVHVSFRQLIDELSSLKSLSEFIANQSPGTPVTPKTSEPADSARKGTLVSGPVNSTSTPADVLNQLLSSQLELMGRLLNNGNAASEQTKTGTEAKQIRRSSGVSLNQSSGGDPKRFGPYRPIEKGAKGGLSAVQQKGLQDLISRYVSKTGKSKAYTQEHRRWFADPRAVSGFKSNWKEMIYPIVSQRSLGSRLWDLDGNEYVDITMGFGTYFFGHSPEWITDAIRGQLEKGMEIGPQSPVAGSVAKSICEFTGMDRVTFCNTGSEAVMAAMRLARTVTGRNRIVYFTGDYHGMFEEVLVRGAWREDVYQPQPIAPGIPSSLAENILVLEYGAPESLDIIRAHADEIAGVMVEPVQSRNPGLQPRSFLQELRELTERAGIALIFDEVVTGFRCHPGGAQSYFGIRADLATYGKVVGGGLPIGILAGSRRFMDALDGGTWNYGDDSFPEVGVTFFAGTFVRHPLAMAAAQAVLTRLKAEGPKLQIELTERVHRCCKRLDTLFEQAEVPIRMPHFSAFAMIEHAPDLKYASLLWYYLREKGIHAWEGRPCFFTLAHTDHDFDKLISGFQDTVSEMQDVGFLPPPSPGTHRLGLSSTRDLFPRNDSSPATPAQMEIILSVQMGEEANCAFNESNILYLDGVLDVLALKSTLAHLVERHPALRSRFRLEEDRQIYDSAMMAAQVLEQDLENYPESEQQELLREYGAREQKTPFDLASGPLIRFHLFRLGSTRHALMMTAHHLVCDGWSFGVLLEEMAGIYNQKTQGQVILLPPAANFGEYAHRVEAELHGLGYRRSMEYWLGQYTNTPPPLELPTDRPRPTVKAYPGGFAHHVIADPLFARIKTASPQLGGTLFATLLGAFATLLNRITGQEDLVIAVPAAGQMTQGTQPLVGHCLNLLPLRIQMSGKGIYRDFATQVKQVVLEAYEHQEVTYGSLVQCLKLPRDTSRSPLVSVMFNIDKAIQESVRLNGLDLTVSTNPKQSVNFEMFFNLVQREKSLEIQCEYRSDLFDEQTILRWLHAYETLLKGIVESDRMTIESIPILDSQEKHTVLEVWNETQTSYPHTRRIEDLVSEQAKRFPDKPAVHCRGDVLTYSQLEQESDQLARELIEQGAIPGQRIGLLVERSVEMVIGLLAILKTGAAYVPLDPAFPTQRLATMVEDAQIRLMLSQPGMFLPMAGPECQVVLIQRGVRSTTSTCLKNRGSSDDPAYVIFTSGSTGRPKGVQVAHRSVVNFLQSMRGSPGMTPEDVLLSVTTLSFDIAGLEIWLPLTTGASVVIASREITQDARQLLDLLNRSSATLLQATPITWRLLLEAGWKGSPDLKCLVGGEQVPLELVKALIPRCSEVWNMYGPTETTIWSTLHRFQSTDSFISIGKPIDNTQVYVVNAAMEPQLIGIAGELLIGGDGVAMGYLNDRQLSESKFIPDVFSKKPGARLYRTGDLARWHSDGTLECLGRIDHQVKIRGFRIELGEIESLLESHPAIQQAAVQVVNSSDKSMLAAYVTLRGTAGTTSRLESTSTSHAVFNLASHEFNNLSRDLREFLQSQLPEYMIPGVYLSLKSLPLTLNGKINRKALPTPEVEQLNPAASKIPPGNELEQMLVGIWQEVLGVEEIGVADDFFELGGDSLTGFRITSRANQAGLSLSPRHLFQHRTISALCSNLNNSKRNNGRPELVSQPRRDSRRQIVH